ncbi:MAG TPA: uracil phosphoribosyltransferase [Chloroflexota bacterium]|nr:uracil phosphoribosyltransferase [Chloroflexota bacterium]
MSALRGTPEVEPPEGGVSVHISQHPLVRHKLGLLRRRDTPPWLFRQLIRELTLLLLYEATADLALWTERIETPLEVAEVSTLAQRVGLAPILRAGLGMVEAALELFPTADVRHLGIYRDHATLLPVEYYSRLQGIPRADVYLILDPMLATGQSAVAAVDLLTRWGVQHIKFVGIIGAPEGIRRLHESHPAVEIYLAAEDRQLNAAGYILPGLGDAGDRQFRT